MEFVEYGQIDVDSDPNIIGIKIHDETILLYDDKADLDVIGEELLMRAKEARPLSEIRAVGKSINLEDYNKKQQSHFMDNLISACRRGTKLTRLDIALTTEDVHLVKRYMPSLTCVQLSLSLWKEDAYVNIANRNFRKERNTDVLYGRQISQRFIDYRRWVKRCDLMRRSNQMKRENVNRLGKDLKLKIEPRKRYM